MSSKEKVDTLKLSNRTWIVYGHISPSGKVYVGITSQNPKVRWQNGNGYLKCKVFYRAIEKYGWDSFQHNIIASNLGEEAAKEIGATSNSVTRCCRGEVKTLHKFKFVYEKNYKIIE